MRGSIFFSRVEGVRGMIDFSRKWREQEIHFFENFILKIKLINFNCSGFRTPLPFQKKKQQQKPGHVIHVIFGIKSSYNLNLQFSRIVKSTFIHSFGIPLKRKPLNQFLLHYAKHLEGSSLIVSLFQVKIDIYLGYCLIFVYFFYSINPFKQLDCNDSCKSNISSFGQVQYSKS